MIFRQLFDPVSSTYTYLLAQRSGGEALLIDPVRDNVAQYLEVIDELDLQLVMAIDTHVHADHITGLGLLRDSTGCATALGEQTKAECISIRIREDDILKADGLKLRAIYTPGHTDDSYSFVMDDRVFTGDTLLIRGTGRTDFQNGDPAAQYDSLFNKLLRLPEQTQVYPAHDYNGQTVSSIGEEKRLNPRLQVKSKQAYVDLMNDMDMDPPRLIDVAVPANLSCGR
jgi:glyoxylase-like metal-dependent hydrolase (beta-lactamase superfamily II)